MAASLDPRVEQLLAEFRTTEKFSDAEQSSMRCATVESPYLAQFVGTNLDRGALKGFTAQDTPMAGCHFSNHDGVLNVSRRTLKDAATTAEGMDLLVGMLAHEAAHWANQKDRVFRLALYHPTATRFTRPASHRPCNSASAGAIYAELHSVNAVIFRIKYADPKASV